MKSCLKCVIEMLSDWITVLLSIMALRHSYKLSIEEGKDRKANTKRPCLSVKRVYGKQDDGESFSKFGSKIIIDNPTVVCVEIENISDGTAYNVVSYPMTAFGTMSPEDVEVECITPGDTTYFQLFCDNKAKDDEVNHMTLYYQNILGVTYCQKITYRYVRGVIQSDCICDETCQLTVNLLGTQIEMNNVSFVAEGNKYFDNDKNKFINESRM